MHCKHEQMVLRNGECVTPTTNGCGPKRPLLALAAVLIFMSSMVTACGSTHTSVPTVVISGNPLGNPDSLYKPSVVRITTGDSVTWVDHDDSIHTVTPNVSSSGWSGGSSYLHRGQRYSFQFKRVGTYRYHCMVHPNMLGVVIVSRPSKT